MKYEINKPASELSDGYFNLILKYLVLLIAGWVGGWIFIAIIAGNTHGKSSGLAVLVSNHPEIISILISGAIVYFLVNRTIKKYKLGLITSIEFKDIDVCLQFSAINTISGRILNRQINYSNLRVVFYKTDDKILGPQRIYEIYNDTVLVNRWNIEMTAWIRHPNIEEIIDKLDSLRTR